MYLDMGLLTGVGLKSPGISNGHRARDMSCLEGGTFVSICMHAVICLTERVTA